MLIHPSDIKISKRFDIYPKLLYAKRFANNTLTKYEHDVYYHHTKVYNNFTEFDDPTKVGYENFIDRFDDLLIDASANILFTKHVSHVVSKNDTFILSILVKKGESNSPK